MSEADQHLLELVVSGDPDGWKQFIGRYQKRLIAFAVRRTREHSTAEDLVQETFLSFLKGMADYQTDKEPEALLFHILRCRLIDHYRKQGRSIQELMLSACQPTSEDGSQLENIDPDAVPSDWSAQQEELSDQLTQTLHDSLQTVAQDLQSERRLRDLKVAEGLFYAGLKNKHLAKLLDIPENEVAYVKHRLVKKIREAVTGAQGNAVDDNTISENSEALDVLTEISPLHQAWEQLRPTCPKRTTLGKYIMGLLDTEWQDYVRFHAEQLGCTFCQANLDDLQLPSANEDSELQQRLLQSTIGFLKQ